MNRVRADKWFWAARFFKTRSLAVQAIEKGRVRIDRGDGQMVSIKPAKEIHVGDRFQIDQETVIWEGRVLGLSEVRGPAPIARLLYEETPEGRERRLAELARRALYKEPAHARDGRPTKRERRDIGTVNDAYGEAFNDTFHRYDGLD